LVGWTCGSGGGGGGGGDEEVWGKPAVGVKIAHRFLRFPMVDYYYFIAAIDVGEKEEGCWKLTSHLPLIVTCPLCDFYRILK
jgi:hypothetical protein